MQRFRLMGTLLLAAFWLLATQHCGLEAAGVLAQHCEQQDGSHGCGGVEHGGDGCKAVEGGGYKPASASAKVTAPPTLVCVALICFDLAAIKPQHIAEPAISEFSERPRDWVPIWHFVQRAALSPRAPSLIFA